MQAVGLVDYKGNMKKDAKRIRRFAVLMALAAGIVSPQLTGCSSDKAAKQGEVKKAAGDLPVTGIVAKTSMTANGIAVLGTLYANEEVSLVAEIAGKVKGIYFREGSSVKKGDLLLKVDDADLQAELMRAQFELKLLSEKLERQRILLERESVSREAFDQVQTDYNMLQADIELLEVRISRTEIRAPFDGTIGFRYVSEGSYVQASTPIATIVDNSVLKLEFSISERYSMNDLMGKEVVFQVVGSDKTYEAKVYALAPSLDENRMLTLRARFQNRNMEDGVYCRADGSRGAGDGREAVVGVEERSGCTGAGGDGEPRREECGGDFGHRGGRYGADGRADAVARRHAGGCDHQEIRARKMSFEV